MVNNVVIVSIVGLLCLDRVFIQTMISRPVVSAPLIGLILGDPYTGLVSGAFIELFWIDRPAIGAYIPPNDTIAAVLIAAGAIESGRVIGELSQGLIAAAAPLMPCFGQKNGVTDYSMQRKIGQGDVVGCRQQKCPLRREEPF